MAEKQVELSTTKKLCERMVAMSSLFFPLRSAFICIKGILNRGGYRSQRSFTQDLIVLSVITY